jgi:translation initiation factor 1A
MADEENVQNVENPDSPEAIGRVRTPRGKEVFGLVESRLGFGKSRVICSDKKVRVCRVPGKYRRQLWANEGDVVIVEPWQFEGDEKGDIIFKYRKVQIQWLKSKGFLKDLDVL